MKNRHRLSIIVSAVMLTLVVAACGGAATPSPQPAAEQAVCEAVQTWSDEMRTLTSLDPATASAEDIQAQADVVSNAWDDVKTAMEGVTVADQAAIEAGWASLEAALKNVPTDVPIADAIAGIKSAAEPLKTAYKEMADGLGCKIATPY
jgi:ribosomal protein S12 methylthiotransferase accessory factor YcaO